MAFPLHVQFPCDVAPARKVTGFIIVVVPVLSGMITQAVTLLDKATAVQVPDVAVVGVPGGKVTRSVSTPL